MVQKKYAEFHQKHIALLSEIKNREARVATCGRLIQDAEQELEASEKTYEDARAIALEHNLELREEKEPAASLRQQQDKLEKQKINDLRE